MAVLPVQAAQSPVQCIPRLLVQMSDLRAGYVQAKREQNANFDGWNVAYTWGRNHTVYNEIRTPVYQGDTMQTVFLAAVAEAGELDGLYPYGRFRMASIGQEGVSVTPGDGGGPDSWVTVIFRRNRYVVTLTVTAPAQRNRDAPNWQPLAHLIDRRIQQYG